MRRTITIATTLALVAAGACNAGSKGGAQDTGYVQDGDTGAASPGASYTPNTTAPDSNTAKSTGTPGVAGVPQAKSSDISEPTGKSPR